MRIRAIPLILLVACGLGACGGGTTVDRSSRTAAAAVPDLSAPDPARQLDEYGAAWEARCRSLVGATRRYERRVRRIRRIAAVDTNAGVDLFRRSTQIFFRTFRNGFAAIGELPAPPEQAAFQQDTQRGVTVAARLFDRLARGLDDVDDLESLLRYGRRLDRTSFDVPGPALPAEVAQRAPTCARLIRDGERRDPDRPRGTRSDTERA